MTDKEYLNLTLKMADKNVKSGNGGPFAAIIVKNDVIIAEGVNTVTFQNDPTAHAEINAIRNACNYLQNYQLNDCVIYSSCEPCPMCLGAIYWSRPKKLVFAASKKDAANIGFDDDFIYQEIQKDLQKRKLETLKIDVKNKLLPFLSWLVQEKRIEY
jgi:guanine deaminase